MPTERTNLILSELSLVPKGANPMAKAPLFKADTTSNGGNMTQEVNKMSEEMDKKIKAYMEDKGCTRKEAEDALMKSFDEVETLKAQNEFLRKGLLDNGYVIKADAIEKKAEEEFIEIEGEQINKADVPAPILKKLEEAELQKRDAELEKRASEKLPHFDKDVAKEILKFDFDEKVLEALMAADAAFEAVMMEKGDTQTDGDMSDFATQLEKKVEEVQSEKGISYHAAYQEVAKTKEGKALIAKTYKKD